MKITVIPYQSAWKREYIFERDRLFAKFGDRLSRVHHIGSTSVEGLAAKPIIDILLVVPSLTALDESAEEFSSLGYEPKGEFGIKGRRYYRKGVAERTHQIHAFQIGDSNIERHLAFRDYLAEHPVVARKYQEIKLKAAAECNGDLEAYCDGKDEFIKEYEQKAIVWKNT